MRQGGQNTGKQNGWGKRQIDFSVAPPDRWLVSLIVLVACLIYVPFLHNPLQFDDFNFFNAQSWHQYFSTWRVFSLRAIPYATLSDTLGWVGPYLVPLRIESLAIHTLNGVLLYFWLKHLFGQLPERVGQQAVPVWFSLAGALWFVASPVAVYGAGYLVERTILMATMFALMSLLAWVKGITARRPLLLYAAALFCWLSILCKELAVMLPAVLMLQLLVLCRFDTASWRRSVFPLFLAGLASIYAYWAVLHSGIIDHSYEFDAHSLLARIKEMHVGFELKHILLLSRLTQATLFFKYLGLWLLPITAWMSIDMYLPIDMNVLNPVYLLGAVGYLVYGIIGFCLIIKKGEKGLLGLAMLVPWILFFTEFSVVRVQDIFVLYRSYLWMFALPAALPWLASQFSARRVLGLSFLLVLVSMPLAIDRLVSLSSAYLAWDDAAKLAERGPALPGMERIYYNRGNAELMLKQYMLARKDYELAIHFRPDYAAAWNNLANTYYAMGHFGQAEHDFHQALHFDPTLSQSWVGMGLCLEKKGALVQSRQAYGQGCRLGNPVSCKRFQSMKDRQHP
ncbi:MAG: tetratricopeptide repeat protein [Pseudomonadota bacterium]|nr:tetratricopeptide repeat protein [Pseudomonadota bacterium]